LRHLVRHRPKRQWLGALSQAVRVPLFCGSYGCKSSCPVDFDTDGFLSQDDLSGYIAAFFSDPAAEGHSGT